MISDAFKTGRPVLAQGSQKEGRPAKDGQEIGKAKVSTNRHSIICPKCHQILRELQIQDDDGNEARRGIEFGIDAKTLLENKERHCYICAAIQDETQLHSEHDGVPADKASEDPAIHTEYLLHAVPAIDTQEASLELRVNVKCQLTIAHKSWNIFKTFILYPAQSEQSIALKCGIADMHQAVQHKIRSVSADSTDSSESFSFIRNQLKECKTGHRTCQHKIQKQKWRPTRLIAVDTRDKCRVKLFQVSESFEEDYVTLSHCWGGEHFITLTADKLEDFESGIEVSELPQNFKDAIKITRELGFHYIWIDSLCIMQDENGNDWRREAGMMHNVYAHSALNIAATSAPDSKSGLLSRRIPEEVNPPVIDLPKAGIKNRLWCVIDNAMWTKEVDDAPLTQRGWVLQERLLSRRVIHFGRTQILWECREKDATEVLPTGLLPSRNAMKSRVKELDATKFVKDHFEADKLPDEHLWPSILWGHLIERYSRARLTYSGDKLIALSGIATKLAADWNCRYVAGLWVIGIEHLLLWQTVHIPSGRRNLRAPSWSWASVNGAICQPNAWKSNALIAKVIDVEVLTDKDGPFGMVYGGFLKIKGLLLEISLAVAEEEDQFISSVTWITAVKEEKLEELNHHCDLEAEKEPEVQLDRTKSSLAEVKKYYCLPVYHDKSTGELRGLVLIVNPDRGDFERIGSFWIWDKVKVSRLLGVKDSPLAANTGSRGSNCSECSIFIM